MAGDADMALYERPLFSFGTLQDNDIFTIVSGGLQIRDVYQTDGWIVDYRTYAVLDGLYPVLRSAPGSMTPGMVFYDLPPWVLDRLVWFEWPEFVSASINVDMGERLLSCTYFLPAKTAPASDEPWSVTSWSDDRKAAWIKEAKLAMAFYDICSATERDAHWEGILAYMAGGSAELPACIEERCRQIMGMRQ